MTTIEIITLSGVIVTALIGSATFFVTRSNNRQVQVFQSLQLRRQALDDFRGCGFQRVEDANTTLRQILKANIYVGDDKSPVQIISLFSDYDLFESAKQSGISSIVHNNRKVILAGSTIEIERQIDNLIEMAVVELEQLASNKVAPVEYSELAECLLSLLKLLQGCVLGEFTGSRAKQLNRLSKVIASKSSGGS